MPWKKGQSGNLKGAPPGPRRNYETRRALIDKIVDDALKDEASIKALLEMEDKGKMWDIIVKLLPYSIPRLDTQAPGDDTPVVQSHQKMLAERLKKVEAA